MILKPIWTFELIFQCVKKLQNAERNFLANMYLKLNFTFWEKIILNQGENYKKVWDFKEKQCLIYHQLQNVCICILTEIELQCTKENVFIHSALRKVAWFKQAAVVNHAKSRNLTWAWNTDNIFYRTMTIELSRIFYFLFF